MWMRSSFTDDTTLSRTDKQNLGVLKGHLFADEQAEEEGPQFDPDVR